MRVFELAKALGMTSKELTAVLAKLQVKVSSHMAALDDATVAKVKAAMAPPAKQPKSSEAVRKKGVSTPVPSAVKMPIPPVAASPTKPPESKAPAAAPKPAESAKAPAAHERPLRPAAPVEAPVRAAASVATVPTEAPKRKSLAVRIPLTVKELADKLSVSPSELIKHLLGMKVFATINQLLTEEPVEKLVKLYGYEYERMPTLEEQIVADQHEKEDPSNLVAHAPVVTFMGHVDHGKTSLLDAIRETRVVEGEAGGITQHIGAYRVTLPKGTITFLDTPGHEAFTAMRARGANVTDLVVLVVAADDGVMPQTVEAIDHAKAAEATIVVAINKIDKPGAQLDRIKKQLMEHGLMSEEWGGKTIMVPVSAKTGEGIDQLLDMILLEAELLELKSNPNKPARGVVLEGKLSKGTGPVGHVLVQNGTLRIGDAVVTGVVWGRIRALMDIRGHRLQEAGPSAPVEMLGLSGVPQAGDPFMVVPDEKQAREIANTRQDERKEAKQTPRRLITLEEFRSKLEAGQVKGLNLILKADVQGSLEALRETLSKVSTAKAELKFLHTGVGAITESDVLLAEASAAVVIGFNVQMTPEAEELAKHEQVDVRLYRIIYEAVNDIRAALEGLLEPRKVEQILGRAKVLQVFRVSKVGPVAGCQVVKGKIVRNSLGRLYRGQEKVFEGKIVSVKRFKDDVKEATEGIQCGLNLAGFNDYQPDDVIESVEISEVAQKL